MEQKIHYKFTKIYSAILNLISISSIQNKLYCEGTYSKLSLFFAVLEFKETVTVSKFDCT